jgi:putative phosphoribosyl transferase
MPFSYMRTGLMCLSWHSLAVACLSYEVAKALNVLLDLMLIRKLGLSSHEEFTMGTIATGGICVLNTEVIQRLAISEAEIERIAAAELRKLWQRQ